MSLIFTYSAGIATILLALFSLLEDFYLGKNTGRRISMSIGLVIATAATLVSIHGADKQHSDDQQQIVLLQKEIEGLQGLIKTAATSQSQSSADFTKAQETAREQFLGEFNNLSFRVATLQTQVATTDLQKQADKLQSELESTRKALNPAKVSLDFTFGNGSTDGLKHTVALPIENGVVHAKLTVFNQSDSDALEGDVVLVICDACSYATEPKGFTHINGAPEGQRNYPFQHVLAHTFIETMSVDIKPPSGTAFKIGLTFRCRTCILEKGGHFDAMTPTQGLILISNPSVNFDTTPKLKR